MCANLDWPEAPTIVADHILLICAKGVVLHRDEGRISMEDVRFRRAVKLPTPINKKGWAQHRPTDKISFSVCLPSHETPTLAAPANPAAAFLAISLYDAGNGILTISRGALALALFGHEGYGMRMGLLARTDADCAGHGAGARSPHARPHGPDRVPGHDVPACNHNLGSKQSPSDQMTAGSG